MELLRNSVWEIKSEAVLAFLPRFFRVLEIHWKQDIVIVFPLYENKIKLGLPVSLSLKILDEYILKGLIQSGLFEVPGFMLLPEKDIDQNSKNCRDNRYKIILPLIEDDQFLVRVVTTKKNPEIAKYAKSIEKSRSTVHRYLNLYWRYGQQSNAFLTFHGSCGGKGKQKKATCSQRGRPTKKSYFGFPKRIVTNVTEEDKAILRKGIYKYYAQGKMTKKSAYNEIMAESYAEEIESAKRDCRKPELISIEQFYYWLPKLIDEMEVDKIIIGETQWEMNHRALLGSVSENVNGPGDRFEIDATIADVYIVSEVNRNKIIGRPVIYVIIDEASRMVVGLHVSIFWASWDSAKQALLNAFLPKKTYCAQFGIEIKNDDWPCFHYPRALLVDNGEMIWINPEEHLMTMGIQTQMAAVFRGDWKAPVERRFGIANEKTLHNLEGTTKGKIRTRGEKDPRDSALYTLKEITALLIRMFVDYNRTKTFDCLVTKDLISENIKPTPLNYWNWHIKHHRDSLTLTDPEQARAELLLRAKATVTGEGIECEERRYTCLRAENENWFVTARKHGTWRVDARIDADNSSVLWIRAGKRERLIECSLMKKDIIYANLSKADVIYINEWKKYKEEDAEELSAHIDYRELKAEIDKKAYSEKNNCEILESKTARKKNIRKNRLEEQEIQKNNKQNKTEIKSQRKTASRNDLRLMSLIEKTCGDDDD